MTHRFRSANDVLFQTLGDEGILLNLNDSHYYGLDDVAARMWQLVMEHGDIEAVVARMVAEYDVDDATVRGDLLALLDQMEAKGLIQRVSP